MLLALASQKNIENLKTFRPYLLLLLILANLTLLALAFMPPMVVCVHVRGTEYWVCAEKGQTETEKALGTV